MVDFKSVSYILISQTEQRNAMQCISLFTVIVQFNRRSHRATNRVPMLPDRVRALCGTPKENNYAVMRTSAEKDYIPRLCCCAIEATDPIPAVLCWRLSYSLQSLHAMKNRHTLERVMTSPSMSFHIHLHIYFSISFGIVQKIKVCL
jgi:hypothetical protein